MILNLDLQKELKPLYEAIDRLVKKLDKIASLMNGDLFDDYQLAELFGVTTRTIKKWRGDKILDYIKIGSVVLCTKDQVLRFLDTHKIEA